VLANAIKIGSAGPGILRSTDKAVGQRTPLPHEMVSHGRIQTRKKNCQSISIQIAGFAAEDDSNREVQDLTSISRWTKAEENYGVSHRSML
jgi:hypothetical protein